VRGRPGAFDKAKSKIYTGVIAGGVEGGVGELNLAYLTAL
jgi:hypothetical protein